MEKLINIISKRFRDFEIWQEKKSIKLLEVSEGTKKDDYISALNLAVRVFENGKKGFLHISGNNFDEDLIIDNIKFSLERSFSDDANILPEPDMDDGSYFGDKDKTIPDSSYVEQKIQTISDASKSFKKLKKIERISASGEETDIIFYNSKKGYLKQRYLKSSMGVVVVVEDRADEKIEWDYKVSENLESIDAVEILKKAYHRAVKLLNGTPIMSGRYNLFFDSRTSGEFLEVLAKSFIAENVYKKKTIFESGVKLSEKINIVDNPVCTEGSLTYFFDGEGYKTEEKRVMKAGVITDYLYDSYYGRKLGKGSNGSSVRNKVSSPPVNSYTNIYIEPLKATKMDNYLNDLGQVIVVVSLIGMHLVNPVTGEFSVGFDGYILENGQFKKSVSNVSVSGNLKDFFKNIVEIGNNLEFYGNIGSPSLLVSDLVVSGI